MKRRLARERAVQAIFAYTVQPRPIDDILKNLPVGLDSDKVAGDAFVVELCRTTCANLARIDAELTQVVEHWKPERLTYADRAILRLGVCELLFFSDVPPRVVINEYIELAKSMGDDQSPKFVNGVLDKILKNNPRPHPAPAPAPKNKPKA